MKDSEVIGNYNDDDGDEESEYQEEYGNQPYGYNDYGNDDDSYGDESGKSEKKSENDDLSQKDDAASVKNSQKD